MFPGFLEARPQNVPALPAVLEVAQPIQGNRKNEEVERLQQLLSIVCRDIEKHQSLRLDGSTRRPVANAPICKWQDQIEQPILEPFRAAKNRGITLSVW